MKRLAQSLQKLISFLWGRRITILVVLFSTVSLASVVFLPDHEIQKAIRTGLLPEADQWTETNEYRKVLIQFLGGIIIAIGLLLNWRRIRALERTVFISEEGQITDRFSKATEQLGDPKLAVRLGGIFSLERIAKDSEGDHWTVIEVLSAFLREYSPKNEESFDLETQRAPADVQAAFTVIGRRNVDQDPESSFIDLSGAYLVGVKQGDGIYNGVTFDGAQMRGAQFDNVKLDRASFINADLRNTHFKEMYLDEINFWGANLSGTKFSDTNTYDLCFDDATIENGNFDEVDMSYSSFKDAFFKGSNFANTDFQGASLKGANFSNTTFTKSTGLSVKQLSQVLCLHQCKGLRPKIETQMKDQYPHLFDPIN